MAKVFIDLSFAFAFFGPMNISLVHIVDSVALSDQIGRARSLTDGSEENVIADNHWVSHPPMSILVGWKLVPLVLLRQMNYLFARFDGWIGPSVLQDLTPRKSVEGEWGPVNANLTFVIHDVNASLFGPTNNHVRQISIRKHAVHSFSVKGAVEGFAWVFWVTSNASNLVGHVRITMRNIEIPVQLHHGRLELWEQIINQVAWFVSCFSCPTDPHHVGSVSSE